MEAVFHKFVLFFWMSFVIQSETECSEESPVPIKDASVMPPSA
ncbi:MAG TPA: hypothetical protein VGA80_11295 [Flavobacteriaceae bacterium]